MAAVADLTEAAMVVVVVVVVAVATTMVVVDMARAMAATTGEFTFLPLLTQVFYLAHFHQ